MYAIEASGLRKSFRNTLAVDGASLAVRHGEITALLGPNGAGKTTMLMMLLGVTTPDAGTVTLLGRRLPHGRSDAMRDVSFAASYVGLPWSVRAGELLRIFARLYAVPRARVDEVAGLFGIGALLKRYPNQLSSGQRTLVTLARALLSRPRLLVLDEPTASLDPEVSEHVRTVLADVHRTDGTTIVITSHNMADVERLCGRVVFLAGGRVVADGPPVEIAARYGAGGMEETFRQIAAEARG